MCNGYYATNEYKRGTYIFGNIFYNLYAQLASSRQSICMRSRRNMDDAHNTANRLNIMIQYNFLTTPAFGARVGRRDSYMKDPAAFRSAGRAQYADT